MRRMICQGWISLAASIVFGLLIEGLIGFRSPALLDDSVRREMFAPRACSRNIARLGADRGGNLRQA